MKVFSLSIWNMSICPQILSVEKLCCHVFKSCVLCELLIVSLRHAPIFQSNVRRISPLCTDGRHVGFADQGLAQQCSGRCAPAIPRVLFPGCSATYFGILSSGSSCDLWRLRPAFGKCKRSLVHGGR